MSKTIFILFTLFFAFLIFDSCKKEESNVKNADIPKDSLILHLTFDNNISDKSGKANDGVAFGTFQYGSGLFNNALDLTNTTDGFVQIKKLFFVGGTDFTISLWFNTTESTQQCLIQEGYYNPLYIQKGFALYVHSDGNLYLEFANQSHGVVYQMYGPFNDGKWHHLVMTHQKHPESNLSNTYMYMDNSLKKVVNADLYPILYDIMSDKGLTIGKCYVNPYRYLQFKGKIDQVRIYNRNLSSAEVSELYLEQ